MIPELFAEMTVLASTSSSIRKSPSSLLKGSIAISLAMASPSDVFYTFNTATESTLS
jgi:hypothetical protein